MGSRDIIKYVMVCNGILSVAWDCTPLYNITILIFVLINADVQVECNLH